MRSKRSKATDISYKTKYEVWERDQHRCIFCGSSQAMPNAHYLRDLLSLGAINDPKQLYPKDFQKAHADSAVKVKLAKSKELVDGFKKSCKKHSKFSYESGGLLIRPVETIEELYRESEELHHCVRTYDKNVAAGTTEIMFIRALEHPDIPFYTLELKNKQVIQVRGDHNIGPTAIVEDFVTKWAEVFNIKYSGIQSNFNFY